MRAYKMGAVLGAGAFGEVVAAVDKRSGARVAIKKLSNSILSSLTDVGRVVSEVSILTALEHRNVIKLHEVQADPAQMYLVMEFAGAKPRSRAVAGACTPPLPRPHPTSPSLP